MCHLSGQYSDTPLNCVINLPIKLRATTECSEAVDLVLSKRASAVRSELVRTQCSKTARGVVHVMHREMTVRLEQEEQHSPTGRRRRHAWSVLKKITPQVSLRGVVVTRTERTQWLQRCQRRFHGVLHVLQTQP